MVDSSQDHRASAMIALLPTTSDWCHIALPHLTLVYAGEIGDLKPGAHNELAKDAASIAQLSTPIDLNVLTKEEFGDWGADEKVDVLRLEMSTELAAMRHNVKLWNKSEHDYNPHVTVGPVGSCVPPYPTKLRFDKVCVGWGEDYLTFNMKSKY